jgi:lipid A disaccharide synthetase
MSTHSTDNHATQHALHAVLPTDAEVIKALNAQCAFLARSLSSALGWLDSKNYCKAVREIEHALNSVGKMPAHRTKHSKS